MPAQLAGAQEPAGISQEVDALFSQQHLLQQTVSDLKHEITQLFSNHKLYMQNMNSNIKRMSEQPVVRAKIISSVHKIRLSTHHDLFCLWKEHETCIGEMKLAREFTPKECGQLKVLHCFCKLFWDKVDVLMSRGYTSDTVIDRIYSMYGCSNLVSKILQQMREEIKNKIVCL